MGSLSSHERSELDAALEGARARSTDGFTTLYRLLAGPVAAFCRARLGTDVDELVNDVFLGAFRRVDAFAGDGAAFRAYVYRIARNKIFDRRAAMARSLEDVSDFSELSMAPSVHEAPAESQALAGIDANQISGLLATLTEEQREVILLRFLSELSIAEVAAVTGRPETAVKALQRRGIAALRRRISADGGIADHASTDSGR